MTHFSPIFIKLRDKTSLCSKFRANQFWFRYSNHVGLNITDHAFSILSSWNLVRKLYLFIRQFVFNNVGICPNLGIDLLHISADLYMYRLISKVDLSFLSEKHTTLMILSEVTECTSHKRELTLATVSKGSDRTSEFGTKSLIIHRF